MELISLIGIFIDYFVHLDQHLVFLVQNYDVYVYGILFAVIFLETGFVVTPFLPGDSLLFAVGTVAALDSLNVVFLIILLSIAAILGDNVNYVIGRWLGPKVFRKENRFFKKEYADKTRDFYKKYGKKTIVIARFVPIIRTFAPFIAGIGKMEWPTFLSYNIFGGILWVFLFILGGYFFGNIPIVRENFSLAILIIILVSIMPGIIEYIRRRKH